MLGRSPHSSESSSWYLSSSSPLSCKTSISICTQEDVLCRSRSRCGQDCPDQVPNFTSYRKWIFTCCEGSTPKRWWTTQRCPPALGWWTTAQALRRCPPSNLKLISFWLKYLHLSRDKDVLRKIATDYLNWNKDLCPGAKTVSHQSDPNKKWGCFGKHGHCLPDLDQNCKFLGKRSHQTPHLDQN